MTNCLDMFDNKSIYMNTQPERMQQQKRLSHPVQIKSQRSPYSFRLSDKSISDQRHNHRPSSEHKRIKQPSFTSQSTTKQINNNQFANRSIDTFVSDKSNRFEQMLNQSNTNSMRSQKHQIGLKTPYVDIAYNEYQLLKQIKKKCLSTRQKSVSSVDSLNSSFEQMERRFSKANKQPEMIDQKYMINGFFHLIKDHKTIIANFKAQLKILSTLLIKPMRDPQELNEGFIIKLDQFFLQHTPQMKLYDNQFSSLEDSLQKLIQMNINEPYLQRVKQRYQQVQKHKGVFGFILIYSNAFEFLRDNASRYFIQDQLLLPPNNPTLNNQFKQRILSIREQLNQSVNSEEGKMITKIFLIKTNKICEWFELLLLNFTFCNEFSEKYNFEHKSSSYKIIKSEKLYQRVRLLYQKIQSFLVENYSLPVNYLLKLEESLQGMNAIKEQIIKQYQSMNNNKNNKQILQISQFRYKIQQGNNQLIQFFNLQENDQINMNHRDKGKPLEIIQNIQQQYKQVQGYLGQINSSKDTKKDEYLQKVYNKCILQLNIFEDLAQEINNLQINSDES